MAIIISRAGCLEADNLTFEVGVEDLKNQFLQPLDTSCKDASCKGLRVLLFRLISTGCISSRAYLLKKYVKINCTEVGKINLKYFNCLCTMYTSNLQSALYMHDLNGEWLYYDLCISVTLYICINHGY